MFATERLVFRAPTEDDVPQFVEINADLRYHELATTQYPKPMSKKWVESLLDRGSTYIFQSVITLKETGEFIGHIGVDDSAGRKNRDGKIGMVIVEKDRSKGYGKEALQYVIDLSFRSYGLHRVSLNVSGGNVAAKALYEKVGFVEEGRIREANWVNGKWEDVFCMGILESDWLARQASPQ